MNQIARCDWLPERARWSHLARLGLPAVSHKQNLPKSHIINPLLTKFVRSRWLDIGPVLFLRVYGRDKHAKKELGQYPAILTSHLVNNPYLLCSSRKYPYSTTEGIGISWGGGVGGSVRPKNLKKCMKLNLNFQTSGGGTTEVLVRRFSSFSFQQKKKTTCIRV